MEREGREGKRGAIADLLRESEIIDLGGIVFGLLAGSVGIIILSTGLLLAKKEGVRRLEKK